MFDFIFDSICRVGIFVICAQTIIHFKPKEIYEKYLRYLVSVMVLIQLFLPLSGFLLGGGSAQINRALKQFEAELKKSMEEAESAGREAEERLESMTLEEVRRQMEAIRQEQQMQEGKSGTDESAAENAQDDGKADANGEVRIEWVDPITIGN